MLTCGVRAEAQDRIRVDVRDLPLRAVRRGWCWLKRRWRCVDPDCPAKTWTEESDHVAPRAVHHSASGGGGHSPGG